MSERADSTNALLRQSSAESESNDLTTLGADMLIEDVRSYCWKVVELNVPPTLDRVPEGYERGYRAALQDWMPRIMGFVQLDDDQRREILANAQTTPQASAGS